MLCVPRWPASVILSVRAERPAAAARYPSSMNVNKKPRTRRHESTALSATQATRELEELNRIGIALSETRDVDLLLDLILRKAREIAAADAGSLYLVEKDSAPENRALRAPRLRFKLIQNDSVQFPFSEHMLPLTEESIAGYCALHGEVVELADAYRVPKSRPFHFNSSFDQEAGYRTRSLIALPMKNGKGEVLGVLQLINCKRNPRARLTDRSAAGQSRSRKCFSEPNRSFSR